MCVVCKSVYLDILVCVLENMGVLAWVLPAYAFYCHALTHPCETVKLAHDFRGTIGDRVF